MKREVLQELVKLPNLITSYRLLSVPVLWVLAILDYRIAFVTGFTLAVLTDSIDGYVARRFNMVSEFGGKFDSLADCILGASLLGWLIILRPEIFQENVVMFLVAVSIAIINFLVGWVRFKWIGNLHLYSAKCAVVMFFVFFAHAFLSEGYSQTFLYFAMSVYLFALLEGLAIFLTQDSVDEHIGSMVLVYKRTKQREARDPSE
jgi:phosphatidylglycerophosphate synthase